MKITRVATVSLAAVAAVVALTATQAAAVSTDAATPPPAVATAWQTPVADLAVNSEGNVTECKKQHPKPAKIDPKKVSTNTGGQEVQ